MNYESRTIAQDERPALPDYDGEGRRRKRNIVVGVVVALLVAALAWTVFGHKKPAAAPAGAAVEQVPSVSVIVPGRSTVDRTISATGTIAARVDMPVGVAGEGGMVTAVRVQPGQWVNAGQVLASVDRSVQNQTAQSLAAQISVARSDQSIAQSELDRAAQLVDRGFISKADLQRKQATLNSAAARVKVAQATLREAQARTGRLDIRAPAAGLVLARNVEPGQVVSAGSGMLFRMAKGGQMELRAQMSEQDLTTMHVGAPAVVTPVGSTQSFKGEVWQVSPVIDPQSRQGIARVALKYDTALRPGGFAQAEITSGAASVPQLPESAVQSDRKGNYVYVVGADNKVARRAVTVGQVTDQGVSVTGGLTGSERVVSSAGAFLSPGQKVKPINKAS
ncbi:efflux RND transporter periplasmic adaptor subunit [Sphingomonas oligophenolica]|uniref:Efflux RND transporter periplasmic adaptor subunit n=1 Tax=Sphingomonas oligophenolica TaxID=301154 RepID=A0A502CA17_9SPHN|nr:efflux RND transporter periplasmic adaptor subunit [Sphingomonas oligophenolica]TPG10017.1 efflux RND transporter periplasmic adaptor subunit [Sphingomonas oligophenolica]